MAVIQYQLFIIATLVGAWLIGKFVQASFARGKRLLLVVAGFWTLWTVAEVYTQKLAIIQLGVTWGTVWLLHHLEGRSALVASLRSEKDDLATENAKLKQALAENASLIDRAGVQPNLRARRDVIRDEGHRGALLKAVDEAKTRCCIVSGWISDSAVDRTLLEKMQAALARGMDVYVGYGYQYGGSRDPDERERRAIAQFRRISESGRTDGRLYVGDYPTHEKLVVKDDEYVILGSCNWLANESFRNRELSFRLYDAPLATALARDVVDQVRERPVRLT